MRDYVFIASECQIQIAADPTLHYAPAPFHGTKFFVERKDPSKDGTFKRFRRDKEPCAFVGCNECGTRQMSGQG